MHVKLVAAFLYQPREIWTWRLSSFIMLIVLVVLGVELQVYNQLLLVYWVISLNMLSFLFMKQNFCYHFFMRCVLKEWDIMTSCSGDNP